LKESKDERVICKCGQDMIRYPEAFLCLKCDSCEVALLSKKYYNAMLEKLKIKTDK
jgi:hypothetical protein